MNFSLSGLPRAKVHAKFGMWTGQALAKKHLTIRSMYRLRASFAS